MGEVKSKVNGSDETKELLDVWRYENPPKKEFTRKQEG